LRLLFALCSRPNIHADIREFVKRKNAAVLQPREQQVFDYFRVNAGRIISRDELSLRVWGFVMDGRSRTIDQTVATLRKKLPRGHDIITHHRVGYEYLKR
jgi:two-component system copper resistance phosphate regulon response regulator CusR